MEIYNSIAQIPKHLPSSVIALGNFDGFHRGHQVVIGEAGRIARAQGLSLSVFTTEPHPRSFFNPKGEAFRLTPQKVRAHLLASFGVEQMFDLNFDKDLAATEAQVFVTQILLKSFNAKHIVVGFDYRFGKQRKGDVELLKAMSKDYGFGLTIINPVSIGVEGAAGEIYSSSLVRETLKNGEARKAAGFLGHWWRITGTVIDGDKRGRELGFPTANIEMVDSIIPCLGIYAVRVKIAGRAQKFDGVANIGRRPTFDCEGVLFEVYIFNFDEDLYGQILDVDIVGFIREEKRFEKIEDLKKEMAKDCIVAKQILSDPENEEARLEAPSLEGYLKKFPKPYGLDV